MKVINAAVLGLAFAAVARAAIGDDYITEAPATVYEAAEMSPQNMDFDADNNMFVAHSGWYNDKLVHYYKFRIFAPGTYQGLITGEDAGNPRNVPVQKIYFATTTGGFDGVVGKPIIQYHTADGNSYSDFMAVNFVTVPEDYTADTYKSEGDIMSSEAAVSDSRAVVVSSDIVLNIPVVPTDSTLQDPHKKGTETAPIAPVPVWYKGVEVHTYVFEVTDQAAADYFSSTRTSGDAEDGFAIPVVPTFASPASVSAIPLWHVNQYSRGVTEGNGGGPNPAGMRNIINLDRPDPGYSPLWLIVWVTELPINYSADEASNSGQISGDNGFGTFTTPMFVNCPDIGKVGEMNSMKAETFQTEIDPMASNVIQGAPMKTILKGGVPVSVLVDGTEIGTTDTMMLGAFEYEIMASDIPDGATAVSVEVDDTEVSTVNIKKSTDMGMGMGADYISEAPATVYEATEKSPQNMDFDADNNMFVAHTCWYNDKLVHYYKFRVYAPGTYPGLITSEDAGNSRNVPIQEIYFVTTTGDFDGVVGKPIIEYHTADGNSYSDFMEVKFVKAPDGYTADTYKSEGDIMSSGADVMDSDIVLNIPVVPTDSTLQDPEKKGTETAPIAPVPVWYKGVEVHTYVFEVTDQAAADYFAPTRTTDDAGFAIPVSATFASPDGVLAIPLWHMNQHSRGVTEGVNGGGPNPAGMRNIINLDRPDPGYSPLWLIEWVTELPINYSADEASNSVQITADNGFATFTTPMFVNCPDIGNVDDTVNSMKAETFQKKVDPAMESNVLLGAPMKTILKGDVPISIHVDDGTVIGTTKTTMMGAYEYDIMGSDIPDGTTTVVVSVDETEVRTVDVGAAEMKNVQARDSGAQTYILSFSVPFAILAISFFMTAF